MDEFGKNGLWEWNNNAPDSQKNTGRFEIVGIDRIGIATIRFESGIESRFSYSNLSQFAHAVPAVAAKPKATEKIFNRPDRGNVGGSAFRREANS